MSGIGGIGALVGTMLGGPLGGILSQLVTQAVSAVAQEIIQKAGDAIGAPQSMIDMAQGHAAGALGDPGGAGRNLEESIEAYGKEVGATPSEIGDAQRTAQEMATKGAMEALESDEAKEAKAGGGKGGGGWLMALAKALGAAADKKADKLEQMSEGLDKAKPSETAAFQAETQAFNMLMSAITSTIKGIGEAMGTMAKRN